VILAEHYSPKAARDDKSDPENGSAEKPVLCEGFSVQYREYKRVFAVFQTLLVMNSILKVESCYFYEPTAKA